MMRSFKLKPSTVHEKFGDETVILNLDTGSYYSAQGAGSVIWGLVAEGASEHRIIERLTSEFAGDGDEISRSTSGFLDELVGESLVDATTAVDGDASHGGGGGGGRDRPFLAPILQKYTDMEEMLLLDPIHEVDEQGWPTVRKAPA